MQQFWRATSGAAAAGVGGGARAGGGGAAEEYTKTRRDRKVERRGGKGGCPGAPFPTRLKIITAARLPGAAHIARTLTIIIA
jgi:hypothetical protein